MRPEYYVGKSGQDVTDFLLDFDVPHLKASAIEYIVRAGVKTEDPTDDIRKAIRNLERYLEHWDAAADSLSRIAVRRA